MGYEGRFHLGRRDIDAAHLEHVVGASAVDVIAVLVDAVLVAAARPGTLEGVLGRAAATSTASTRTAILVAAARPRTPVHDRRGRAADLELAELARLGDDAA